MTAQYAATAVQRITSPYYGNRPVIEMQVGCEDGVQRTYFAYSRGEEYDRSTINNLLSHHRHSCGCTGAQVIEDKYGAQ